MKNIYILIAIFTCLGSFWACDSDRDSNPTLHTPDTFVLNTPKYVSGIYDLKNTDIVELTCSQPDYGFTAATIYKVMVSVTGDFTEKENSEENEFKVLSTSYTTAKMDLSARELAVALVGLQGIENEEDYPADPFPVYIRVTAELASGLGKCTSNQITLPRVKGYFALEPLTAPENMYIIGNVAGDWKWENATVMVPVHSNDGMFWAIQYLGQEGGADAEIKFNMVQEWNETAFGYNKAVIDEASIALAGLAPVDDGNDPNIKVTKPGWYLIVVKVEIDGLSYINNVQILPADVYLTGDPSGGYDVFDEARLFTVPDVSLGSDVDFVSPAFVAGGEVRACVKLADIDWWKTEFVVLNGKLEYRGKGDDQERVSGSTGQKLYINFTKKTGKIE